jgi:hypothetical protein
VSRTRANGPTISAFPSIGSIMKRYCFVGSFMKKPCSKSLLFAVRQGAATR